MKFGSEADRRMSQSVSVSHLSTSGWGGQGYKQRPQDKAVRAVRAVRATDNPTEKPPSQTLKRMDPPENPNLQYKSLKLSCHSSMKPKWDSKVSDNH